MGRANMDGIAHESWLSTFGFSQPTDSLSSADGLQLGQVPDQGRYLSTPSHSATRSPHSSRSPSWGSGSAEFHEDVPFRPQERESSTRTSAAPPQGRLIVPSSQSHSQRIDTDNSPSELAQRPQSHDIYNRRWASPIRAIEERSPQCSEISDHSVSSRSSILPDAHDDPPQQEQHLPRPSFNPALYPGYDEHGNRRGLDHLNSHPPPQGNGDYYTSRTYLYPPSRSQEENNQLMNSQTNETPSTRNTALSLSNNNDNEEFSSLSPSSLLGSLPGFDGFPFLNQSIPMPESNRTVLSSNASTTQTQVPALVQPLNTLTVIDPSGNVISHRPQAPTEASPAPKTVHELLGLESGTPISLDSLSDPEKGQKPDYPYPTLMKLAIYSSPKGALTLQEIYDALEKRFEWFAKNQNWKGSIRHTLSLLSVFQRKPKPITEPGKGHYWYLDFSKTERNKRVRKRNKKPTKAQLAKMAIDATAEQESDELDLTDSDDVIDPALQAQSKPSGHRVGDGPSSGRGQTRARGRTRAAPYPAAPGMEAGTSRSAESEVDGNAHSDAPLAPSRAIQARSPDSLGGFSPSYSSRLRLHGSSNLTPSRPHTQFMQAIDPSLEEVGSTRLSPLRTLADGGEGVNFDSSTARQRVSKAVETRLPPMAMSPSTGPPLSSARESGPRFGQSTFGPNNLFTATSSTSSTTTARGFMSASSSGSFPSLGSGFTARSASTSNASRSASTFLDRNAPIKLPAPRPGIELVMDGGLPRARRVTAPSATDSTPTNKEANTSKGKHRDDGNSGEPT